MADVKWIKIVTDIFDDDKILLIESMPEADAIIVMWFKLLCLAGKQNNSGVFILNDKIPYTDEMFATIFRRQLNTVRLALQTFEKFGMIEIINGAVTIPKWGKHQNFDKIEAKNEYMRGYMRDYREKQKALSAGNTNCKTNSESNVSEAEKKREEKKREEGEKKSIDSCSEPEKPGSKPKKTKPDEPVVYELELNDVSMYGIPQSDYDKYVELYPAVDVMQQFRNMTGWIDSNPHKRKTRRGVKQFITNWLSREQDKASKNNRNNYQQPSQPKGRFDRSPGAEIVPWGDEEYI